jgi:Pretoxin HINT domain
MFNDRSIVRAMDHRDRDSPFAGAAPYAYAQGNPATYSDHSDLFVPSHGGYDPFSQYSDNSSELQQCTSTEDKHDQQQLATQLQQQQQQKARGRNTKPVYHGCSPGQWVIAGRGGGFLCGHRPKPDPNATPWGGLKLALGLALAFVPGLDLASPELIASDIAAEEGGASSAEEAAASCGGMSFTVGTRVLLASGSVVPISQLKVGDKVLATNTRTGKTQAETVAAVLIHRDTDLYDLKLRAETKTAVIDTTTSHLFWVLGTGGHDGRWVKAGALRYGTHLRTPSGGYATVLGGWTPRQHSGWMWDLAIPGDHDFYIDTATAAVLVHNCSINEGEPQQTVHGAERAADPSRLSPAAQAEVIANSTQTFTQADGAQVFVQQVGDRYNVVVQGENGVY